MPYLGKTPSQATRKRYYKTASGGETSISGTMTTGGTLTFNDGEFVDVSVNGVALVAGTDYNTTTANTIGGLSALSANDQVEIVVYDTFSVFGGNVDGDFTINNGDLALGDGNYAYFGASNDLRVGHTGSASVIQETGTGDLFIDATNFQIRNGAGTETLATLGTDGAVELYHDNSKKFETTSSGVSITGGFAATDGCTISTADNDAQLTLTSTDADASVGPLLDMIRDSSSPADSDTLGRIRFRGDNDAGEAFTYGTITSKITDASDSTEGGLLTFLVARNGSVTSALDLNETETVFNEGSLDADFRVESNGNANMLFVDGGNDRVGIGTGSPGAELDIESTGPTIHLNDSNGVLAGAITSRIIMQASGSTHGIVGFGSSVGNMAVTNAQGNLYLQADTNDAHSTSFIAFTVDNSEKARITDSGDIAIGKTGDSFSTKGFFFNVDPGQLDVTCNGNNPLRLNRLASDGILTSYQQAGSEEGTVSVSGTTVSYNGGHLSRWSQATDGNRIDGLVKGTVMTNLDQMAVWSHDATEAVDAVVDADGNIVREAVEAKDAYTEDNEQLNCMAVSSVEGDANVAGVFVNWDDRDSFNDMNIAMTGDMVIRIAQGTTVARGDLLMSAGDGTAKPQDDDIVRSKTIAKVTSTTKSHTYDDGSYLVPCVLMAC